MRGNWAQVYVTLAGRERERALTSADTSRWEHPQALIDTALMHDPAYVPALLEQATLHQAQHSWSDAAEALDAADDADPDHAPTVVARAELLRQRSVAEGRRMDLDTQIRLYQRALALETDLAERAELNERLRELYFDAAKYADALKVADDYVRTAAAPSTYLRDRRDEAAAFAASVRSSIGYGPEVADFFQGMVARKPQHYGLRAQAALALQHAGRSREAIGLVEEGQRILGAGGQRRTDYSVMLASALASAGSFDSARAVIASIEPDERVKLTETDRVLLARTMVFAGMVDAGASLIPADSSSLAPRVRAERLQVLGYASLRRRDLNQAARLYRQALTLNPYHFDARAQLIEVLVAQGKRSEARELAEEGGRVIGKAFPVKF
jgi:tetratricopeptide (TPR) repeat protein